MTTPKRWHHSLAARYGIMMVGFVSLGSLLLLTWLRHQQQEEAQRVFVTVAQNEVNFVREMNLPRSSKLADDLRQLLRVEIHFRDREKNITPQLKPEESEFLIHEEAMHEVINLPTGRQALVLTLDQSHDMIFVREPPTVMLSLLHPTTGYALLAFWLFSALFAGIVGRHVVGPVGRLTRALTGFFGQGNRTLPETHRTDEIGELARALTQARDDLNLERERREASERLALLGRVATGLAHEIKNPLASIQLHAQLMEGDSLDYESQSSLSYLLAEVRVIEGLVNQWLYLARPAPPKQQPLELLSLVQETIEMLRPQADYAGTTLEIQTDGTTAYRVQGDHLRLQQVFRNVILNAIQAMPGGGLLEIRLQRQNDDIQITFHDEGKGFTVAALQQGEELFFSEKEGGMGVGLNVAREIIIAHQGRILLKNHPKRGAEVQIALPMIKT